MNKDIFLNWNSWFYRAVFLLLILLLIFSKSPMPLPQQIRTSMHYRQIMKWHKADAKVLSSSWKSVNLGLKASEKQFCPILEYAYTADGRAYQAQNQVFEFSCNPSGFKYIVLNEGSSIGIVYDPSNPAVSVIPDTLRDPGFPWGRLLYTIVWASILTVFLIGNIRYYWRLRQERIREESEGEK